jgi:hypothetical protein
VVLIVILARPARKVTTGQERAQRALLYGVGAAGTGALTGALLGPVHYTKSDLKQGGVLYNEFEAYVRNQYSNGTFTSDDDEQLKFLRVKNQYRNEKVGAGLAAAAAATYGATRSLNADSSKNPPPQKEQDERYYMASEQQARVYSRVLILVLDSMIKKKNQEQT